MESRAPCLETPSRSVQTSHDRERNFQEPRRLSEEERLEQEEEWVKEALRAYSPAEVFHQRAPIGARSCFGEGVRVIIHSVNAGSIVSEQNGTEPAATTGVVSEDQVKLALRRVKDPDLQLNIIDLGLVYGITVDGTTVKVDMTLTSPACLSGPELMTNAETEVKSLPGVEKVEVNLVWMPFWTPEKMEPRVRAYLGF